MRFWIWSPARTRAWIETSKVRRGFSPNRRPLARGRGLKRQDQIAMQKQSHVARSHAGVD